MTVSTSPGPRVSAWPSPAYGWSVVAVLCLANVVSFIDRSVITLMVDPIKSDLGLSEKEMGLLIGFAFALFYGLVALPIGFLADHANRTRIITIGVFLWTLATAACGLARTFGQLFLARMSVGIGEATLAPSTLSLIPDYFPRDRMARPIAAFAAAGYAGYGIALLAGGLVVQFVLETGPVDVPLIGIMKPWQFVFLCVAAPGILAWLMTFLIREPVRRGIVRAGDPAHALRGLFTGNRGRAYLVVLTGFPVLAILGYGTASWVPTFLIRLHGWSPGDVAWGYGLVFLICGTAGPYAGGWLTDYLAQKGYKDAPLRAAIGATLLLLPFTIAFPLVPNDTLVLVLLVPVTFLGALPFGVSTASLMAITPNRRRALVGAVYLFIGNLVGLGVGPLVVASLTEDVFADPQAIHYALAVNGAVVIPVGVLILILGLARYRRAVEAAERAEAESNTEQVS